MPPNGWTTPEELAFLRSKIGEYLMNKARGTFWKFWPDLYEEWFRRFPEEGRMNLVGVTAGGDAASMTPEQRERVGIALEKRKEQLETWFRHHSKKAATVAVAASKAEDSLTNDLFQKKLPRHRPHRPSELFQKRNKVLVDAALEVEGFFDINEAQMAATMDNWAEESEADQKARIKEAQAERMRIRTRVVDKLFSETSEEELRSIEELCCAEKKEFALINSGTKKGRKAQKERDAEDAAKEPTPEEYQLAIDESAEVVARVHRILAKKTGWYGITIYGGPNPRYNGGLSMKSVCFGRTHAGNDFESAHGSFDTAISKHFQAFLKRSFTAEERRARALLQLVEPVDTILPALDGLFRLPDEDAPHAPPVREKAKRMRKKTTKKSPAVVISIPAPATSPISATETPPRVSSPSSLPSCSLAPLPNSSPLSEHASYALHAADGGVGSQNPFNDESSAGNPLDGKLGMDGWADDYPRDAASPWPAGMGPPTSPRTAEATANVERGVEHGATYRYATQPSSPPIDPALLDGRAGPNRPRPAWNGAASSSVPQSPTPTSTKNVMGFNFHMGASSSPPLSMTPSRMPPRLNGLINRFHQIMHTPSSVTPAPGRPLLTHVPVAAHGAAASPVGVSAAPVAPNSPARMSRISSTAAGAVELAVDGSQSTAVDASSSEPPRGPFRIRSRPMANDPTPAKAAPAQEKKKTAAGRGGGRKKVAAQDASTKEAVAKEAAKVATKKAAKGKGRGARGAAGDTGDIDDPTNFEAVQAPLPVAAAAPAPTLIYTSTNNSAAYARMARKSEAEKKAKEVAARKERARLHNPDGPSDLVILPAPGRAQRARKAARNLDGSEVALEKKLTRAEQQAMKNKASEDALLKRTGRKRGAEEALPGPSRPAKK
ncbi:hypothetical protein C8R43DRAFT_1139059 [Mycena crocata]|nr:hypothetical protein C8R43DRAFT_1139059 [Mycena crocata]